MVYTFTGKIINKEKGNKSIYELIDENGRIVNKTKKEIKYRLYTNDIHISNLKLTTNGRLIQYRKNDKSLITDTFTKLGKQAIKKIMYYNEQPGDEHRDLLFVVGNNATKLRSKAVAMGINIICTSNIFGFRTSDKIYICTENNSFVVADSFGLFDGVKCNSINFNNINTKGLESTADMFRNAIIKNIDLSNLDMSNVTHANSMFEDCITTKIIFRNRDFRNLIYLTNAFRNSMIGEVILENINMQNVASFDMMFREATINNLIINNIKLSDIASFDTMFRKATILKATINNFNISAVSSYKNMFMQSNMNLITDNKLLKNLKIKSE